MAHAVRCCVYTRAMSDAWHYAIDQDRHGPVSEADLKELVASGTVTPDTLVWRDGLGDWVRAGDVPAFFAPAQPAAPPTTPGEIPERLGDATGGVVPYKNPASLIGYYLGVASIALGPVTGVFAVILGVIGLRARHKRPHVKGSVHACIAIAGGLVFSVGHVAVYILILIFVA